MSRLVVAVPIIAPWTCRSGPSIITTKTTTRTPHRPHENPERWDCECGGVWRILSLQQVEKKFAHLKRDMT